MVSIIFFRPQIYLIPKTPSAKRNRRLAQITEDEESIDDENDGEDYAPRVQQKKKKQKFSSR